MELRSQECGNVQLTAHTDSVLQRKPLNQPIINEKMKVKVPPTARKVEPQLKEVHQPLLPITNNLKVAVDPRGPRKHCVISAYILNEKSRVRLGTK